MIRKEEVVKSINKKIIILNVVIVVGVICLFFSAVGVVKQELIATAAETYYEEVAQEAVSENHETIDFSVVSAKGSTATSWLYIPGTKIDYPLVQGPNNDMYLDTDAYGNKSEAGAIFVNFANAGDMSDAKTVIFGHNMQNGSMFTDLHKYQTQDYGNVHQDAYIYMDSGEVKHYKLRYYLFTEPLDPAVYVVSKKDVASEEARALAAEANIIYGEHTGGKLICLSTCTMHKYRTVVVFEYVDDKKPIAGSVGYQEYEEDKVRTVEEADGASLESAPDEHIYEGTSETSESSGP